MTIIITDDHVKRLLTMKECIEAMRMAFKDFSEGKAVNPPRMRYAADHPDPTRKYLANVHLGAVPSAGIACVRAGSQIIIHQAQLINAGYMKTLAHSIGE